MIYKKELTDAYNLGFTPGSGAADNAFALQKAINEYKEITVNKPGIYDISGTIRLPSHTHLRFSKGVIIRRSPLDDKTLEGNLFVNTGAFSGEFNIDISIDGVTIIVNGVESAAISSDDEPTEIMKTPNAVTGLRGHISFLYIKQLRLKNIDIHDLSAKDYGIQISDFDDAIIENVHIEGKKDGVHFGPGKNFVLRNGTFRTGDDAIALNCADYSVSNPNFGTISDGLIENCVELEGADSGLFIRILVGTAREWVKGMTVCHSDAVRSRNGMYRVLMKPDNKTYISDTEPDFEDDYKILDGILWVKTHKAYMPGQISLNADCKNIIFRNLRLEQPRKRAVLIYINNDAYLRSWYPGSETPVVSDIRFEDIKIMNRIEQFLDVETQTENLLIENLTAENSQDN